MDQSDVDRIWLETQTAVLDTDERLLDHFAASVRREALEKAARLCETTPLEYFESPPDQTLSNRISLAAAIRALMHPASP